MELSKRLKALAALAEKGNTAADIGCDHGYVSIWLAQNNIFSKVIAMDGKSGPLEAAAKNIRLYHVENKVELRLSDGLSALSQGEADSIFCAGMGGALICRILSNDPEKVKAMSQVILQPQSEIHLVRRFLREHGLVITKEDMIKEDGKYYPMFRAVNREMCRCTFSEKALDKSDRLDEEEERGQIPKHLQDTYDYYGMHLLKERHPVLHEWLLHERSVNQDICSGLLKEIDAGKGCGKDSSEDPLLQRKEGRLRELQEKQERIETALAYY